MGVESEPAGKQAVQCGVVQWRSEILGPKIS